MSAKREGSADLGDGLQIPPAKWERTSMGGRLTWWPTNTITRIAVFRVVTDDDVAVLQHIREIVSSQRNGTCAQLDEEPELEDVPKPLVCIVEADGLTVATEVEA